MFHIAATDQPCRIAWAQARIEKRSPGLDCNHSSYSSLSIGLKFREFVVLITISSLFQLRRHSSNLAALQLFWFAPAFFG